MRVLYTCCSRPFEQQKKGNTVDGVELYGVEKLKL